nr:MAG TPA: hypothetical protein [Caudoviricetes sp.]
MSCRSWHLSASVSLSSPSSLLRMGLMSIASAARMTVISEQVDATVDRFIGIFSLSGGAKKAALSCLTKRRTRCYTKASKSGARARCLSLPLIDLRSKGKPLPLRWRLFL